MDDNLQSMEVVMGEPKPETIDQEIDQPIMVKKTETHSTREEEKRIREEIRKQKEEDRERRAEEKRKMAEEREEARKQREEEKERKLCDKRKREEDREEARIHREEEKERKLNEKKRRNEEQEAARIKREEERRQKQEEIQGRLCKGTCEKYRSRNPPKSHQSRWFVCYGCKSYCLCLICGVNSKLSINQFQEHARICDPYYNDRIVQSRITALFPPTPVQPPITYEDWALSRSSPPPANASGCPIPPPPTPVQQPITYEDVEDEYEPDPYAKNLSEPAKNLLNFYQPPEASFNYSESSYKGCWTGDSRILKFDGTFVHARDINPGDQLLSSTGSCAIVNAVIVTTISDPVKIVQLSQHCSVTSGHPIFNTTLGDFVRADSLKPSSLSKIDKLFNFELNRDCDSLTCDGGIIGATVGKSFDLVKKFSPENDTLWGCNYWATTQLLLQQNHFNNIKYLTGSP